MFKYQIYWPSPNANDPKVLDSKMTVSAPWQSHDIFVYLLTIWQALLALIKNHLLESSSNHALVCGCN